MISVIVPCYNAESYLRETLDSILEQTYSDIEIVVINDGSTDSSGKILEQYRDRIILINQENKGVAYSRNKGIEVCNGTFIAFCDADDVWLPNKLKRQIDIFEKHKDVGIVSSETIKINAKSNIINERKKHRYLRYDQPIELESILKMEGNVISLSSAVARGEVIRNINGFDTVHNIISKDYDLWLRSSEITKFYIISEPLVKYRVLEHSMIHGSLKKEYKPQFQWLHIHRHKYSQENYNKRRSAIYRDWSEDSFCKNEIIAWKLLRKSIILDPGNMELRFTMAKEAIKSPLRKISKLIK